jgi:hypothetical protein
VHLRRGTGFTIEGRGKGERAQEVAWSWRGINEKGKRASQTA